MTALHRKLLRDLWRLRGPAIAIALVMAVGVAMFTMSLSTIRSLADTQRRYYQQQRFAEVFAHAKRAPDSLRDRLREIPGVASIDTRVVVDVNLTVPGFPEPATARLISLPAGGAPTLNALHVRSGRLPAPRADAEVAVSDAFARAHGLRPGDTLSAVINERYQRLVIVGSALSPEYVYQVRPGEFLPDEKRFAVMWMNEEAIESAFDMDGAFNDAAIALVPGASEPDVIAAIDRLLDPYGGVGAHGRDDQISHRFVTDELKQLRVMAILPPSIFLSVASFLVNIVLARIVRSQRDQIATLKAFGYSARAVALHYLLFALAIVALGSAIGVTLGLFLGRWLTGMYVKFFNFPFLDFQLSTAAAAGAVLLCALAASVGALASVRQAAALMPAEAMRPESPPAFRRTFAERLGLKRFFSPTGLMAMRHLQRRPFRSALTMCGIALGVAVVVLGNFSSDAVDVVLEHEFSRAQRQDLTATFVEPASHAALSEMRSRPGVLAAEPFRAVPVRLRFGHRHELAAITGVAPDAALHRVIDTRGRAVEPRGDGLVLSSTLAEALGARPGDLLTVEALEGQRPVAHVRLDAIAENYMGESAVMRADALHRLMREGPSLSGVHILADAALLPALYTDLRNTPRIAGVTVKDAALVTVQRTIAENLNRMRVVNAVFASIIAFGVVYNSARITLAERAIELASLRVLGFHRGEIAAMLLSEMGVLVALAIPVGFAIGYAFAALAVAFLSTQTQRIPLVVGADTFARAATVILAASLLSALVVRRRIDTLDLVAALKSRA